MKGKDVKLKKHRSLLTSLTLFVGLFWVIVGIVLLLWAQDLATWREALSYFLLGVGGVFFIDTMLRYTVGPRSFMGLRLSTSLLFLSAGGALLAGIGSWWPLLPILVGLSILFNMLLSAMLKK
jgi:hypothetical protein